MKFLLNKRAITITFLITIFLFTSFNIVEAVYKNISIGNLRFIIHGLEIHWDGVNELW
ncbi:MAG: hypothetical protein PHO31_02160 [Candidatus Pacebacteria bacterium]|nr:hypothetical protein [Candidatus Paceibacterota bacterium]